MSASDDEEIPGREVAHRLFAAEYDDASLSHAESDEERAPNYVIAPTGARVNRLFAVGTLTEVSPVNDEMLRARVVDPTGAFVVYAGQYQPDELAALEQLEPPAFVAVTGKARTFQPEDSDQVYTSVRPESIATVDADTRDRWVISAAEQTLERIGTYAGAAELDASDEQLTDALADAGVENGFASGIPLAQDHYGTTPSYLAALRDCAREAVEVVADEREQVSGLDVRPGETSAEDDAATFGSLATLTDIELADLEPSSGVDADTPQQPEAATATADQSESIETGASESTATSSLTGTATSSDRGSGADSTAEPESMPDTDHKSESESASDEVAGSTSAAEDSPETEVDAEPGADAESSESEAAEPESEPDDDLGDFDAGDGGEMYEMDEEEREQIEAEYGTEFTTGSEVDEPGEADIDVPEPDDKAVDSDQDVADSVDETEPDDLGAPPESGLDAEPATDAEPESDEESDADEGATDADSSPGADDDQSDTADAEPETDPEPDEDVDVQARVIETMEELDDGDGADRSELVETVASETGVPEADIEDAIQDALMGGQCYEPGDDTLKAI
ncbi:hypothetical protein ACLI4Z_06755 [Natrialbaceae archaeon A-arb3/5]